VLWGFVRRYAPDATPANAPMLEELIERALAYYRDFVKPSKSYRLPDANERAALAELAGWLDAFAPDAVPGEDRLAAIAEAIQQEVYEIGKRHGFADDLRAWFRALYQILLGQSEGPRFGSFVAYYGVAETTALIRRVLDGERPDQSAA
jgi:lysyl-tRNA synthetase class 1